MTLYHGSETGGLSSLEPRLADHGRPHLYLTANAVIASFYMVKAVDPPCYWAPYGFDPEGIPVYHELYSDALHSVYAGKCGYLYRVEAAEEQITPLRGIPGAYGGILPAHRLRGHCDRRVGTQPKRSGILPPQWL